MKRIDELMAELEGVDVFEELRRVDEALVSLANARDRDRDELARWRRRYSTVAALFGWVLAIAVFEAVLLGVWVWE